jgi:hypothetical protein
MHISQLVFPLTFVVTAVTAGPVSTMGRRAAFTLQNGQDAQALNKQFQSLTATSPCTTGETSCVNGQLAQCVGGKFALTPCAGGETCVALPLVNKAGTRYAHALGHSHRRCGWIPAPIHRSHFN